MMDAKYLAEIKAQEENAVALSQEEWNWIKGRLIDRPYLIKTIAQLSKDNAAKDQQIATLKKSNATFSEENHGLYGQIATLKKALELAAELYGKATGDTWNPESTVHDFIFMAEHPAQTQEQEAKK